MTMILTRTEAAKLYRDYCMGGDGASTSNTAWPCALYNFTNFGTDLNAASCLFQLLVSAVRYIDVGTHCLSDALMRRDRTSSI